MASELKKSIDITEPKKQIRKARGASQAAIAIMPRQRMAPIIGLIRETTVRRARKPSRIAFKRASKAGNGESRIRTVRAWLRSQTTPKLRRRTGMTTKLLPVCPRIEGTALARVPLSI